MVKSEKQTFTRSGNVYGEFSAMNVVNAEKEKQTFLRSKNVYGELSATNEMNAEKEKQTFFAQQERLLRAPVDTQCPPHYSTPCYGIHVPTNPIRKMSLFAH